MVVLQESLETTSWDLVWEIERGKKNKVYHQGTPLFRWQYTWPHVLYQLYQRPGEGLWHIYGPEVMNHCSEQTRQHRNKCSFVAHTGRKDSQKKFGIIERILIPMNLETWLPVLSLMSKLWLQNYAISWSHHAYVKDIKVSDKETAPTRKQGRGTGPLLFLTIPQGHLNIVKPEKENLDLNSILRLPKHA